MANKNIKVKGFADGILRSFNIFRLYELVLGVSIVFAVAFIPLLVRYAGSIPMSPEEVYMLRYAQLTSDIFSFYRSAAVKYVTILMGIVFALDFFSRNFGKHTDGHVLASIGKSNNSSRALKDKAEHDNSAILTWRDFIKSPEIIIYTAFFVFSFIAMLVDNQAKYEVFGINEANSILFAIPFYFFVFSPLAFIITGKTKSNISKPIAAACLAFFACVVITSVFTRYKYLTFNGSNERFESIYALLGYIIIFLSVIRFAESLTKLKIVAYGLAFSAAVIGLIAVFQMYGKDFFSTGLAVRLFAKELYAGGARSFDVLFKDSAYSLLYNPNTLGLYASMTTAFFIFSTVFIPWRSPHKLVFFILAVISAVALYASRSSSGLISIGITCAFGVLVGIFYCVKTSRNVVPLFVGVAVAVVVAATAILLVPSIRDRISYLVTKVFTAGSNMENQFLMNLKLNDNEAELVVSTGSLNLKFFADEMRAEVRFNDELIEPDSTTPPLETNVIKQKFTIPGVGTCSLSFNSSVISMNVRGSVYNFYADENDNGKLYILTSMGIPLDINEKIPSLGFEGNEMFASGRGYIWSRTLPLMKKTLLKGYGVDSFVVSFPQYDIVGKTRFMGNPNMTIDKAHNGYFQIAVNTGVISMLAVVFLFIFYIARGVKNIMSHDDSNRFVFALKFGLVMAVFAYSITFFTTDSTLGVSPMFWGLLGLGIAVNQFSGID